MLSYPFSSPADAAVASAELVRERSPEAAALLDTFAARVAAAGLGEVQEAYTRAFDLDTLSRAEPTCYPYVGHYLFDESHKRGAFILELRRRFRAEGFDEGGELGDHLVVLLRFLAVCSDETLAGELVDDAILPALSRIGALRAAADRQRDEPSLRDAYVDVLRALELALAVDRPAREEETVELEREWLRDRDSLGIDRDWCRH